MAGIKSLVLAPDVHYLHVPDCVQYAEDIGGAGLIRVYMPEHLKSLKKQFGLLGCEEQKLNPEADEGSECTLENGVLTIAEGTEVFRWKSVGRASKEIKEIVFPSSLREISEEAFEDCTALESVTLPEGLKKNRP